MAVIFKFTFSSVLQSELTLKYFYCWGDSTENRVFTVRQPSPPFFCGLEGVADKIQLNKRYNRHKNCAIKQVFSKYN